jgi:hypothetical protein
MRTGATALAAIFLMGAGSADAQSYNGRWEAAGPEVVGRHCPAYDAHIIVAQNAITIRLGGGAKNYVLKGQVASDGSFTAEGLEGKTSATGKFTGSNVEMALIRSCGSAPGSGHRAPPQ